MVVLLPFFFLSSSFFPFVFPKAILIETVAILTFSLWMIGRAGKEKAELSISFNKMFLAFGIYVLAIMASALNGVAPALSLWSNTERATGVIFIISVFLLSLVSSAVFKSWTDWKRLFQSLFVSSIIFTLLTIIVDTSWWTFHNLSSSSGFTFGNSTYAGIYLAFCFFISLGLGLSSPHRSRKIIYFLGSFFIFLNPIISGFLHPLFGKPFSLTGEATTAFISIIVGSLVAGFWMLYRKADVSWKKGLLGVFIFTIISSIALSAIPNGPVEKFVSNSASAGPTRFVFWDIGWQGFKDRPILGWGGDTYNLVYGKYFNPLVLEPGYSGEYWVDKSHNIYVDELVSGGVVGFLAFALFMAVILWGLARKAMNKKESFMNVALFAGVVSFMIEGLMTFQTIFGWLALGLVSAFVANNYTGTIWQKNKFEYKTFDKPVLITTLAILVFVFGLEFVVIKPFKVSKAIVNLNSSSIPEERANDYKIINNAYFAGSSNLDQPLSSINKQMVRSLNSGVSVKIANGFLDEIDQMDILLQTGLAKENYMDIKLLATGVKIYSTATAITFGQEQKNYYERGLNYVQDILRASPANPLGYSYHEVMKRALNGQI